MRNLVVNLVQLVVIAFTVVIALGAMGVPIAPLVAGISVAGVGASLAMQGVLGNLVAGLLIIFTKPYRVGEYIDLLGVYGQVTEISLFSTITIAVKPWVAVDDFVVAQAEIYQAIVESFQAHHIAIPFPQREIRLLGEPPARHAAS